MLSPISYDTAFALEDSGCEKSEQQNCDKEHGSYLDQAYSTRHASRLEDSEASQTCISGMMSLLHG